MTEVVFYIQKYHTRIPASGASRKNYTLGTSSRTTR